MRKDVPVVPVVRLQGTIGIGAPLRPALTLGAVADALDRAFAVRDAKEIALVINSPGGSPVQSHLLYKRIRALAQEKDLPVTAFVEDVAASGGYMLACAADSIVADPSSIIGSIGVVSASFGFDRALEKLGVERRVHTVGERKSMLDPFLPERPDDVKRLQAVQKNVHRNFVALVRERRGAMLQGSERTLFSGEFWLGERALELGLIDGLGDLRNTLRARYGDAVEIRLVGGPKPFALRRVFGTEGVRWSPSEDMVSTIEARALGSRYGL